MTNTSIIKQSNKANGNLSPRQKKKVTNPVTLRVHFILSLFVSVSYQSAAGICKYVDGFGCAGPYRCAGPYSCDVCRPPFYLSYPAMANAYILVSSVVTAVPRSMEQQRPVRFVKTV